MTSRGPVLSFGQRYQVLGHIGSGGMGHVYLALDLKHDRRVAIKMLDPEYAKLVGSERFLREIRIASALTHPSIVPLYDSGECDGRLFYVMPYIEGESLRVRLQRETMLPLELALAWAQELCDGLAFAHAQGIIHRDLKPENILIQGNRVLLADFGIARAIHLAADEAITSSQVVLGTPVYMSPEQASGDKLDARTDIYSLGCVIYEMLVGEPPFTGNTVQAVTARKMSGHYPSLRLVRPSVPKPVDQAIAKAIAVLPADRFGSVGDLALRLRGKGSAPGRLIASLAAAAVGVLVLWAGIAYRGQQPSAVSRPRVVVKVFDNRTGDPQHTPVGVMAADWITEGLYRTGAVDVVPTTTSLAVLRTLEASGDTADVERRLVRETGSTLLLSGAFYLDQDSLVFHAQLTDPLAGRLVGIVKPLRVPASQPGRAVGELRERLMGLLAIDSDERVLHDEEPPTYAAYKAFSDGLDSYVRNHYDRALEPFLQAYAADTTFVLPLLYASFCKVNLRHRAGADSLLEIVAMRRQHLNNYDAAWLDYQRAELRGNNSEALAAIRRAAELAPASKASYNYAATAFEARLPFEAESTLRQLSPDIGPMRGWWPYWDILTNSLHAQGKHREELAAAREARRRFPDRTEPWASEARALAADRKWAGLERLWRDVLARPEMAPGLAELAYEIGSEAQAHGDSAHAVPWLERALARVAVPGTGPREVDSRWLAARALARLGRLPEAMRLGKSLLVQDAPDSDVGFVGVLAAHSGVTVLARELLNRLAASRQPYTFGVPQYESARIAATLGDAERARELFTFALDRGYPYSLGLHRDEALAAIRKLSVFDQLDIRRR